MSEEMMINKYPNIRKAFLEMSYDNGGINIGRTEEDAVAASQPVMERLGANADDMSRLDAWIGTLTDDQILTLVAGEETEAMALVILGPAGADNMPLADIFNDLFEVC